MIIIYPEELDDYAWDMAVGNVQTYGIDLCDCDDENCELEHIENTNIEGYWKILND